MPSSVKFDQDNTGTKPLITAKGVTALALVLVSIIVGLVLSQIPLKFQATLILLIPALIACLIILRYPFVGICCFYVYEYARPDSFFPALRPLRIALLIEGITLVSWLFLLLRVKPRLTWHPFNWAYIALIAVIASTVLTAVNNRLAYNVFEAQVIYFVIFFMALNLVDTLRKLSTLIWALLLVHVFFALRGIITGGFVGGGLMGDENDLALALNTFIPFAFFMLFDSGKGRKKLLGILMLVALMLGVIASMSRGGWVGLMAALGFCIYKSKQRMATLGVTVLLALAALVFAPSEYWDEIQTISDTQESTAQTRLLYWKAALRMFQDYPATGVGASNGGIRMSQYYRGPREATTQWGRTFHGTFPQVIAELGSLGLFCYLLLLWLALTYLNRIQSGRIGAGDEQTSSIAKSIMGGIIGFQATGVFLSVAYYPQMWTMYALTLILVICVQARTTDVLETKVQVDDGGRRALSESGL